jgi:uncharacterized membrane protein (UPF0127 family)
MKKSIAYLIGLWLILGLSLGQALADDLPMSAKVCIKKACFRSEVVATPEAREMGLMFHKDLAADEGMLFAFDQPSDYAFWMKNMSFSIDIVWISADQRVVDIAASVPPCTTEPCPLYTPLGAALFVLEIPAGAAAHSGMAVGDSITISQ